MLPGDIKFTLTWYFAILLDKTFVYTESEDFAIEYGKGAPSILSRPAIEPIITTEPFVFIKTGQTELTLIPLGPNSFESDWVIPLTANLDAQ